MGKNGVSCTKGYITAHETFLTSPMV